MSANSLRKARRALDALDSGHRLDRRTWQAQFIKRAEAELLEALGGAAAVSPQEAFTCRLAARSMLLLEQVEGYIQAPDGLGHPINRGKRALFPIVQQRQALADSLLKQLQAIGLERRATRAPTLAEYARTLQQGGGKP